MGLRQTKQIERMFRSLVSGHVDAFLRHCADDLIITTRGTDAELHTLSKADVADWFGALAALSSGQLQSAVHVAPTEGHTATVILSHSFRRDGVEFTLDTINLLTLRGGQLIEWSSYPLNLNEFAQAWSTAESALLQSA
jgi:ketosteroid isomerase-like protein